MIVTHTHTERERQRGRDIGRGKSRLHAPGARCGIRSRVSRIAPWAKGRRQTAAPPRDPSSFLFKSKLYAQCRAWAQDPEIKSHMLYWLSQPGVPGLFIFKDILWLPFYCLSNHQWISSTFLSLFFPTNFQLSYICFVMVCTILLFYYLLFYTSPYFIWSQIYY